MEKGEKRKRPEKSGKRSDVMSASPRAAEKVNPIFDQLPATVRDRAGILSISDSGTRAREVVMGLLREGAAISDKSAGQLIQSKIGEKSLMLDPPKPDGPSLAQQAAEKRRSVRRNRSNKFLPSTVRKELRLFDLPPETAKYDMYLPLHALWSQYIAEVVADSAPAVYLPKLAKADFHGALVTVTKCKSPAFVGLSGIILQETCNTFRIVTNQNEFKTLPKANTIFTVPIAGSAVVIYGSQFCFRTSERATKRFHAKPTIAL